LRFPRETSKSGPDDPQPRFLVVNEKSLIFYLVLYLIYKIKKPRRIFYYYKPMFRNTLRKAIASVSATALLLGSVIVPGMGFHNAQAQSNHDPADQAFVDWLVEDLGVDTSMIPAGGMTRGQVCSLLWEADGAPTDSPEAGFTDITGSNHWNYCKEQSYFDGTADGRAASDQVINRQEVSKPVLAFLFEDALTNVIEIKAQGAAFSDWSKVDPGLVGHVAKLIELGVYEGIEVTAASSLMNLLVPQAFAASREIRPTAPINGAALSALMLRADLDKETNVTMRDDNFTAEEQVRVKNGETTDEVRGGSGSTVVGGDLTISLDPTTPAGTTVPSNASSVTVMKATVSAGDKDAEIEGVILKRTGVSKASDIKGVTAYLERGGVLTRISSDKSVNADTNEATFSNLKIMLKAGEKATLIFRVDMEDLTSTGEMQFSISTADDLIVKNAKANGVFPIMGSKFTTSTTDAGTITITKTGVVSDITLGAVAKFASFKVTAASEDGAISEIGLQVKGLSNNAIQNPELRLLDGTVIASLEGELPADDIFRFKIDPSFIVKDGSNKSLEAYAHFVNAENSDVVKTSIDTDTDLVSIGQDFGFGMKVVRTAYDATTCTSSAGDCSYAEIKAGKFTIVQNGPTTGDDAVGGDDIVALELSVTPANDTTIKDIALIAYADDNGDSDPLDATDDADVGHADMDGLITGTEASLKDIKIVDKDTGTTIFGPKELSVAATAGNDASQIVAYTDDLFMKGGVTQNWLVTVDIDNNMATGTYYALALDISGLVIEDINGDTVASSEITPSTDLNGNKRQALDAALNVTQSSTPVSDGYVKGTNDVGVLGVSLRPTGDAVTITSVKFTGYLDVDADGYNDISAGTDGPSSQKVQDFVTQANLYIGSTKIAGPESIESDGTITFDSMNQEVTQDETEKMELKVDLAKPTNVTSDLISFSIAAATDITAQDSDGDSVTTGLAILNAGQATFFTITDSGSVFLAEEGSPSSDIVVEGAADVLVSKYKATATNENMLWNDFDLILDTNNDSTDVEATFARSIDSVKVRYDDADGNTVTKAGSFSAGRASFTNLGMQIKKDKSAYLEVLAIFNTTALGAVSGDAVRVVLDENLVSNTLEFVGEGSGQTLGVAGVTLPTNEANVKSHVLRKSTLKIATQTGLSTIFTNGERVVYGAKVSADSNDTAYIKRIKVKMSYNRDSNASGSLGTFKVYKGSEDITSDVTITSLGDAGIADATDFTAASIDGLPGVGDDALTTYDGFAVVTWTNELVVPAGQELTLQLRAQASGVNNSADSLSASIQDDTAALANTTAALAVAADPNLVWSDGSAEPHNVASSTDFTNGYDVVDLSTATLSENF
jgi:hypothetical protein